MKIGEFFGKIGKFLKQMVTSHSGTSSKRTCGAVGWLFAILTLVYCTIAGVQAPVFIDTFIVACTALLGVDSVTGIWRDKYDRINKDTDQVLDKVEQVTNATSNT